SARQRGRDGSWMLLSQGRATLETKFTRRGVIPRQPRIARAARSAISMTGALVFPEVMVGIADASATRRPATRYTRQSVSSTVAADRGTPRVSKAPIAQVPTG